MNPTGAGMKTKILVVDDERSVRLFLTELFEQENIDVALARNGAEALEKLASEKPDIIVLDLKLPDSSGLELIPRIKKLYDEMEIIVITALGTVENAVRSIKLGAFDFITKPFDIDKIMISVQRTIDFINVSKENIMLKEHQKNRLFFEEFIGETEEIRKIHNLIAKLKNVDVPILITGETGTGKNILAKQIHFTLLESTAPFIYTNCANIPDTLFESELFGHVKGAFTGATANKKGRVEEAHQGTLLLDEITEIPYELQAKLLNFLQEKSFYRVGSNEQISVKTRIIALSNRDLQEEIKEGRFRRDLFYRLNLIHMPIPPLRERRQDIMLLIEYILELFRTKYGKKVIRVTEACLELLVNYSWPGNVRELRNVLERAFILTDGQAIGAEDIVFSDQSQALKKGNLKSLVGDYEKSIIIRALAKNNGNRTQTAEELDISLRNLQYKLSRYEISD
jgi:two-component system response regulator AtoC